MSMNPMHRIFILFTMLLAASAALCAPIDDARALYAEGKFEEALTKLETLHRRSPRNGNVNYWLALTLIELDRMPEAVPYLETAESRGVADAALILAREAAKDYDPTRATKYFDSYESIMRRNKREIPDDFQEERSRVITMENMLSRVERVAVIDSIVVDADEFFKAYRLSPECGRLVNGATARIDDVEMAFIPQNNTEILYAQPDSAGVFRLMSADILDDGTIDHPTPLPGEDLGGGGNAEYPFLMSDGLTLYFANDGEGSLGGYDIFLTRRTDDGYLQPQNMGMPYNSPDDDYLMAIDETTGAGWWATDRNHIPGMVTIYIFVPSETRVNVEPDSPELLSLARLDNIALTRTPGADYSQVLARINAAGETPQRSEERAVNSFTLPIGSTTRIYTSLSDFRSSQARSLMSQALNQRALVNRLSESLDALRERYRNGDHSAGVEIINQEDRLAEARRSMDSLVNRAISAELHAI